MKFSRFQEESLLFVHRFASPVTDCHGNFPDLWNNESSESGKEKTRAKVPIDFPKRKRGEFIWRWSMFAQQLLSWDSIDRLDSPIPQAWYRLREYSGTSSCSLTCSVREWFDELPNWKLPNFLPTDPTHREGRLPCTKWPFFTRRPMRSS